MSEVDVENQPSVGLRQLLTGIAFSLLAVFAIAISLEPDGRGYGTHQQLGLPPCTFRELTGVNCPHCGMTTCFANFVRGNMSAAWQANPAGIPLVIMLMLAIPYCLSISVSGRWLGTNRPFFWFIVISLGYLTLSLLVWFFQLLT